MNPLRLAVAAAVVLCFFVSPREADAQEATKVVGWRGDGTGCYPSATPPLEWGRINKNMIGVTSQAGKPGEGPSGRPIPDGVIREWMVLGPVAAPAGAKPEAETIPGEAKLSPDAEIPDRDLAWKAVPVESSYLDLRAVLGKGADSVAYAHAYIYSPEGRPLIVREVHRAKIRVWLNGAEVYSQLGNAWSAQAELKVRKGWNRLLLKLLPDAEAWYTSLTLYGGAPWEYEEKNIAWTCRTPNSGNAAPIVVGGRIFVTSDPYDLSCVDKADGKILWVRSNNYFETLTDAEKAQLPDVAKSAARLAEINERYGTAEPPDAKLVQEKRQIEGKINSAMQEFDKKKYTMVRGQDAGYAGMTPVSDGARVWAWFATGVSACYDLDGKRLWSAVANGSVPEHGFATSPILIGGKFIVHMNETIAYDALTGKVAWTLPSDKYEGSLLSVMVGGEPMLLTPTMSLVRVRDGQVLCKPLGGGPMATPVVADGVVYRFGRVAEAFRLPASAEEPVTLEKIQSVAVPVDAFPSFYGNWNTSSPLFHEGLLYGANNDGMLSVVDMKEGRLLYQRKMLDVNICYNHNMGAARGLGSSITLAGKRIYIFGNQLAAVVLEPGPAFRQLAKDRIENAIDPGDWWWHQETSVASPVFDGNRLYYRAERYLYCISAER